MIAEFVELFMARKPKLEATDTYKVVSYNPRRRVCLGDTNVYFYRWYWQAELRSWIDHHLFFMSCNTYVKDGANVKPRPVVWK